MAEQGIVPQLVALDFGLDLTSPKPAAAPGTLLTCLNYERGDMDGMARISGYEPYDGRTAVETSSFKIIHLDSPHSLVVGDSIGTKETYVGQLGVIPARIKRDATEFVSTQKVDGTSISTLLNAPPIYGVIDTVGKTRVVHIGTVVEISSPTRIVVACLNEDSLILGVALYKLDVEGSSHSFIANASALYDFNEVVYDVDSNYTYRLDYATQLREEIEAIPSPCGLVWYNESLYAVGTNTKTALADLGTLYRARTVQQLLDDDTGADKVLGWEELNIGYSLQDLPGGTATAVNSLPSASALDIAQSQYEFIVANFYGSEKTTTLYGVSGASRAFSYDGTTFRFINTGLSFDLDQPRHIAKFKDRLWLAYPNGSVVGSVVGSPEDFSGVSGAVEIAFGDRVVGLQPLAGEALGVFCENSIWYLDKDLAPHCISPNTGCIEYTLAATDRPYYCSANGIMTIEASDKYGEFSGIPLSDKVDPWLRPRLKRIQGKFFSHPSVIGNMIVRTKNQYRLFFRDGFILTMTMTQKGPVFTHQKYTVTEQGVFTEENPARIGTFSIFAGTSQMTQDGTERLFAIHRNSRLPYSYNKVVELDVGWSFAGNPIEAYMETNAISPTNPFVFTRVSKARLYGLSKGRASLKIQTSATNDGFEDAYNVAQVQFLDLPRKDALFDDDYTATTDIKDLADRGLSLKLKVSTRNTTLPEPPHVCQLITLLQKPGEKLDV